MPETAEWKPQLCLLLGRHYNAVGTFIQCMNGFPVRYFNNCLDTGLFFFWVLCKGCIWRPAYFPSRQQMQEQNEMLDQKNFSGTVEGSCVGGHLENQDVANSLFGSSIYGWAHQVGCPQLSCGAFCVKHQQIELEHIAFWIILKTVQSGVSSLQMM